MMEHTGWLFHRVPYHRSCLSISLPMEALHAIKLPTEWTAAAQLVYMVLPCEVAILWQFRNRATSVANNGGVPVSTSSNAHSTHLHLSHPPTHMYRGRTAAEHKQKSHILQLCAWWLASTVANILHRKHNEHHLCGSRVCTVNR